MSAFEKRMDRFRARLEADGIDVALITDDDNVYYLTGYYDYLHMEFGRPTILVVVRDGHSILITPSIDANTAEAAARADRIAPWNDGAGGEWRAELPNVLQGQVAIEAHQMPAIVREYVAAVSTSFDLQDVSPILAQMRMVKSPEELQLARHAGLVANAMMTQGRAAIRDGAP